MRQKFGSVSVMGIGAACVPSYRFALFCFGGLLVFVFFVFASLWFRVLDWISISCNFEFWAVEGALVCLHVCSSRPLVLVLPNSSFYAMFLCLHACLST